MSSFHSLVLGTANRGKAQELIALLASNGLEILTLGDVPNPLSIDEAGESFVENARLKAARQAAHLGRWVLGDDTGLLVDALNGAPGIYSARYAGPNASGEDNRRRLLAELGDLPLAERAARFVCRLALADPEGKIRAESDGHCRGRILFEPRGQQGFGYDTLFEVVEYHCTFGELGEAAKNLLSHRARAMGRLLPQLVALLHA
jgi:XTP/dITP diphosphohydrolase